ncbi:hypothetical protein QZH41_003853 [Actinostola sp. cb2023]|nr:hypothetical protein QZH41_003853 [Actinostola sp. cb2023]
MSKIPTPNQPSRIPSFAKASTPPSKLPPKSRIPSFSKTTAKSEEESKKSQIPTGIPAKTEKPVSKIPGLQRPDPAKENKDPAINGNLEEANKQNKNEINKISRIPSAKSSSSPVSKIPSLTRQESYGDKATEAAQSEDSTDVQTPKSRIPSVSSSQQTSSNPTSVSKIPSFSRATSKHSLTKTPSTEESESKIPTVIPKAESKSTESRIPHVDSPTQKESGIPKPEVITSTVPKPETKTSLTPTESKIPQFSTPKSKIPSPAGSVLTRKDSEERIKKPKIEETPEVEEPSKVTPSVVKVAPPPPPRQDVNNKEEPKASDDSPYDEDIFSEAKKMEELLRNESIVVMEPATDNGVAEEEVSKESSNNNVKDIDEKKEEKKDQVSFKTFGKREDVVAISKEATTKKDSVDSTKVELGLMKENVLKKSTEVEKTEEKKENIPEIPSLLENKEIPAIDTLGQYEQQARRSRSRQRKIISPDAEEPNKTFEQAAKEDEKKALDKEKGEPPSKTEDTETKPKPSKTKTKHDKPKFVIESSLGADFYQSKTSQSKDRMTEDTTAKPKDVVVIQNKAFDDTKGIPLTDVKEIEKSEEATNKDSAAFEDVEISSNKGSKMELRAWSMEQLDEKTPRVSNDDPLSESQSLSEVLDFFGNKTKAVDVESSSSQREEDHSVHGKRNIEQILDDTTTKKKKRKHSEDKCFQTHS